MKKIFVFVVFLLTLVFAGCGKPTPGPDKPTPGPKVADTAAVKEYVFKALEKYEETDSGAFTIDMYEGDEKVYHLEEAINCEYTDEGMSDVKSFKVIYHDKDSDLESYVKEDWVYINRCGIKTKAEKTNQDDKDIINEHSIANYLSPISVLLGDEFFAAAKLEKTPKERKGETRLVLDLTEFLQDSPDCDESLYKLQEKKEVELYVSYVKEEDTFDVSALELSMLGEDDVTNRIVVKFQGVGLNEIEFPDLADYK